MDHVFYFSPHVSSISTEKLSRVNQKWEHWKNWIRNPDLLCFWTNGEFLASSSAGNGKKLEKTNGTNGARERSRKREGTRRSGRKGIQKSYQWGWAKPSWRCSRWRRTRPRTASFCPTPFWRTRATDRTASSLPPTLRPVLPKSLHRLKALLFCGQIPFHMPHERITYWPLLPRGHLTLGEGGSKRAGEGPGLFILASCKFYKIFININLE